MLLGIGNFCNEKMGEMIESDIKKGIIWHTQGSGKTALAYFSIKYLTDLLSKKVLCLDFTLLLTELFASTSPT